MDRVQRCIPGLLVAPGLNVPALQKRVQQLAGGGVLVPQERVQQRTDGDVLVLQERVRQRTGGEKLVLQERLQQRTASDPVDVLAHSSVAPLERFLERNVEQVVDAFVP